MKKQKNLSVSADKGNEKHGISRYLALSLCMLTFIGASAQTGKVSLNLKDAPVKELLNTIEKQTPYRFSYRDADLKGKSNVTLSSQSEELKEVLTRELAQRGLFYRVSENLIIILPASQKDIPSNKKSLIKGVVKDANGDPIIGANITVEGQSIGTITDMDGQFTLEASADAVLHVSYIGYMSQNIHAKEGQDLNIIMKDDTRALDEVVVLAYGTQTKRNVTGSLETVDFDKLGDIPGAQFAQKLQGQISGVQINQGTGTPGQGMNIRIRGAASLSTDSSPLYVVDGFPIVGNINNLNPNKIESMTVLKDAAATALYGSRAAFGVVLITTKTAKTGKTNVSFNGYWGVQVVPEKGRPDMMNGTEWAQFRKEHYEDLGEPVPTAFQNPSQYEKGYSWYDTMLRNALIQDYNVSIQSGSEKLKNSIVVGYFNQDGVVLNSDYRRISLRANSLYQINPRLKAALNVAPTYSFENRPLSDGSFFGGGGLLANANLTPPILPYMDENGNMPVSVTTEGVTMNPMPNWVRSIQDTSNEYKTLRLLASAYIEFEPIKNLFLKTSISTDLGYENRHYFQPSTAGRAFNVEPSALNANLREEDSNYYSYLSETTASYSVDWGDHHLDALVGFTVQKYHSQLGVVTGSNYADDRIQTIDAALVKNNPTMDIQEWSMMSYLGRINYDFKGRYLLGFSIRRDGSSRFGINNRWGNFPAGSIGWLVNEEPFMKNLTWLSLFKLRGSYGVIGNHNIGNYTQYNTIDITQGGVFGNTVVNGSQVTNLGNPNLGWEKTRELDLGVDLSFLNNRITFTYDYYKKITDNLLYSMSVPRESGFQTITGNVGKIKFWGHEFSINSHNLVGAFKWDTNFNIAFSDNRVLALSGMSDYMLAQTGIVQTITKVGGRIGQFYGMVQEGVYVNQADYDNSPKAVDSEVGTIKFKDVNNDGTITYDDMGGDKTELGNPFPKFTYGLTNTFSYKNFDLSIVCAGSYGNKIVAVSEQGTTNLDGNFNVLKEVKDRWRSPENPGAGKYGKTTSGTGRERDILHSRFICDGSHFTIKNITFGYTFPARLIKYVQNLRLYASIQQPLVLTKYKYANPEVGVDFDGNSPNALLQGIDFSTYPIPRTFTIGLNVSF